VELREKEWDIAARVRERALADAREHVNLLLKELATVIARAIAKNRVLAVKKPRRKIEAKPKPRIRQKAPAPSKRTPHRRVKRKTQGQR